MFEDLNPLNKPTAILEIAVMLFVAALLGYLIAYISQKLKQQKLAAEVRFNEDKYETLNSKYNELTKDIRANESLIADLRARKDKLIEEMESLKIASTSQNQTKDFTQEAKISHLKEQMEDLSKENETLRSNLKLINQNDFEKQIEVLLQQVKTLESEKKAMVDKIDSEQEFKAELKNQIVQLQQEKNSIQNNSSEPSTEQIASKKAARNMNEGNGLSIEAFKIKKLALFQHIGTAEEKDKDDLSKINGIGPLIEAKLNSIGVFKFQQIANLSDKDVANLTDLIEFFPGRIERDNWVNQAKDLL